MKLNYNKFLSKGNSNIENILDIANEKSNQEYVNYVCSCIEKWQKEMLEDHKSKGMKILCPECGCYCDWYQKGNYGREVKTERWKWKVNVKIICLKWSSSKVWWCKCNSWKWCRYIPFLENFGIKKFKHYREATNTTLSFLVSMASYWNVKDIIWWLFWNEMSKLSIHNRVKECVSSWREQISWTWILLVDWLNVRNRKWSSKEVYSGMIITWRWKTKDWKEWFTKEVLWTFRTLDELWNYVKTNTKVKILWIIIDWDWWLEKLSWTLWVDKDKVYRCVWHAVRNSMVYLKYFDKYNKEDSENIHKNQITPLIHKTTWKWDEKYEDERKSLFTELTEKWCHQTKTYLKNAIEWLWNYSKNPVMFEDGEWKEFYLRSTSPQERDNRISKERTKIWCWDLKNACNLISFKQCFYNFKRREIKPIMFLSNIKK